MQEEEDVGLCECCALFCHQGHRLKRGAYGKAARTFCDCGAGSFDNIKTLNDQNHLRNVFRDRNDWNECSLAQKIEKRDGVQLLGKVITKYLGGIIEMKRVAALHRVKPTSMRRGSFGPKVHPTVKDDESKDDIDNSIAEIYNNEELTENEEKQEEEEAEMFEESLKKYTVLHFLRDLREGLTLNLKEVLKRTPHLL